MKETITGTGLTKRRQRTVSSKDSDAAEWMHIFTQGEHWGFDGAARGIVEDLAKYLAKKGLPCLDKTIVVEGDQWRYLRGGENEAEILVPSRLASLGKYLEDEFCFQSFEWYAGRIIELSHQAFDKQNIPAAIELGYLMRELKFKEEHEGLAISRLKSTAALKASKANDGRKFDATEWRAEARAAALRIWELDPDKSKRAVAELVQTELKNNDFDRSVRTIRHVIYKAGHARAAQPI